MFAKARHGLPRLAATAISGIGRSLLPGVCPCCGDPVPEPAGYPVCGGCLLRLERAPDLPPLPRGLEALVAGTAYAGPGRRLVGSLKFGRRLGHARLAADLITARAGSEVDGTTVVPVPPSPLRLARRGFDPALEIASALAARLGLPLATPLVRRDLSAQRGRSRSQRLAAAPRIELRTVPAPLRVLLVDDVITTGATLTAAAEPLFAAGATGVIGAAAAATPPPGTADAGL